MAEAMQGRVREPDDAFAKRPSKPKFFREVGAPLIQKTVLSGSAVTIEWMERCGSGSVDWRYRQARDALFYFEQGVVGCRGELDGDRLCRRLDGAGKLAFIEAGSTIETKVDVPGRCFYWVAFIDKPRLLGDAEEILSRRRLGSQIGFRNARLAVAVKSLKTELLRHDELSNLFIDSWAIQALIFLHRLSDEFPQRSKLTLNNTEVSRIVEFMEANIDRNITLDSVASLVKLSPRHFRRVFRASTGVGPSQMFTNIRLEQAARDLRYSRKSITTISLDCGFSQPQHLATAFRRQFGLTPSEFRRQAVL
jgi:AraC family transcriptional regulator